MKQRIEKREKMFKKDQKVNLKSTLNLLNQYVEEEKTQEPDTSPRSNELEDKMKKYMAFLENSF
jgi:hypothetical protein